MTFVEKRSEGEENLIRLFGFCKTEARGKKISFPISVNPFYESHEV